jgi:putative toxin-antitoxin system antitoxin component (TIGR02293 family)
MFLDALPEVERFFELSFKTIKSRLGGTLSSGASELAMRAARVATAAVEVFGSFDAARRYMRAKNFALGGASPMDMIRTAEGERLVLNELQAQAESGPL